jgi:RNA polymerase sigma factor (sigma-70 family)
MNAAQLAPVLRHIRETPARAAQPTDGQLLHAFAEHHDESAFAQIVRRHGPVVLGVCRRVLRDNHDAEDAFQATFLVLARKPGSVRRGEALASFLHGVSYRIALRARRDAARRRKHERLARVTGNASVGGEIAWREVQEILDREIEELPALYRSAFVLCCLQGHSQAEAARQLGVKEGTISSRLTHARRLLSKALARRGISLSAVLAALALADRARAAVPAALTAATVEAAGCFAAGSIRGLPIQVQSLAHGAMPTMLATKMTFATAIVLTIALVSLAAAALWQRPAAAGESAPAIKAESAKDQPKPPPDEPGARVVVGRVFGPDGKPVRGAKVYVSTYTYKDRTDPRVRATTDAEGRFRFTANRAEVDRQESVAVVADGFGLAWLKLGKVASPGEITLRLVKDVPITGRILDLEGRPVAGAVVRVIGVRQMPGEDLTALLRDLQAKPRDRSLVGDTWVQYHQMASTVWGVLGSPGSVTTDKQGRFRLAGFGGERVVSLHVEGSTIAHVGLSILTRGGLKGLPPRTYASAFDHLVGPTKPITGTVKDRRTGKPVAGLNVGGQPDLDNRLGDGVSSQTDAKGNFTLLGLPKAKRYHLNVGGAPYIWTSKEVADTPGLETIRTSVEVERALALRIRVIDRSSGRPIRALIQYAVRQGNPSLDNYPTFQRNAWGWNLNDRDGYLTQTVLPGPALIAVQAQEGEFTRARQKGSHGNDRFSDNTIIQPLLLDLFHSIVQIDPQEKDPKSLELTVALDPGRSVQGKVVGPDGKPLEGVEVAGLNAVKRGSHRKSNRLIGSNFVATGLEPAHPRTLVFLHAEKKLAAAVTLRGDERSQLTVRLDRLGALTGRLHDAKRNPVEGAEVFVRHSDRIGPTLPGELYIGGMGTIRKAIAVRSAKTDGMGRFHLDGIVPGMKYDLVYSDKDNKSPRWLKRDLAAPPGKTVDLGDVPLGPAPDKTAK